MSPLTVVALDPVVTRGSSLGEATRSAEALKQRAASFDAMLSRQSAVAAGQAPVQVAQAQGVAPVQGPVQVQSVAQAQPADAAAPAARPDRIQAGERARRALELEPVRESGRTAAGDLILDGLQKLRGTFDSRQAKVSELMRTTGTDASMLLAMQVEVVNYTLMVDVTSKLTGKSTQSFDTLMKGQ
jgi:type III secretion system YscI/HrpB-like protein